eukprot:8135840-Alexandrium_andersonii.AAC.1
MTAPAPRERFPGSADALLDALSPLISGKSWIRYDESATVAKSKCMPELCVVHKPIVQALHKLQWNLSFRECLVKQFVQKLIEQKQWEFQGATHD